MILEEQINRIVKLISEVSKETQTSDVKSNNKDNTQKEETGFSVHTKVFTKFLDVDDTGEDVKINIGELFSSFENSSGDNILYVQNVNHNPGQKEHAYFGKLEDTVKQMEKIFIDGVSGIKPKYRDLYCTLVITFSEEKLYPKKIKKDWGEYKSEKCYFNLDNAKYIKLSDKDEIPLLKNHLLTNKVGFDDENLGSGWENTVEVNIGKVSCVETFLELIKSEFPVFIRKVKGFFES